MENPDELKKYEADMAARILLSAMFRENSNAGNASMEALAAIDELNDLYMKGDKKAGDALKALSQLAVLQETKGKS